MLRLHPERTSPESEYQHQSEGNRIPEGRNIQTSEESASRSFKDGIAQLPYCNATDQESRDSESDDLTADSLPIGLKLQDELDNRPSERDRENEYCGVGVDEKQN